MEVGWRSAHDVVDVRVARGEKFAHVALLAVCNRRRGRRGGRGRQLPGLRQEPVARGASYGRRRARRAVIARAANSGTAGRPE